VCDGVIEVIAAFDRGEPLHVVNDVALADGARTGVG
jgi:hypothetical protein